MHYEAKNKYLLHVRPHPHATDEFYMMFARVNTHSENRFPRMVTHVQQKKYPLNARTIGNQKQTSQTNSGPALCLEQLLKLQFSCYAHFRLSSPVGAPPNRLYCLGLVWECPFVKLLSLLKA